MRLVEVVKELPPVRALRKVRFERAFAKGTPGVALHRGIYRSFAEARAAAPKTMPSSYDNETSPRMYEERLSRVYPSDYPVLFWLRSFWPEVRRVLDFGGHVGIAFHAYQKYLTYPADLSWTVLDVPAVVAAGEKLAAERGEKRLAFTRSLAAAEGVDLFLAAGSLQFVEEPLWKMIGGLQHRPRHVIVNRSPMVDGESFVTLHNNGNAVSPYQVFDRAEVAASMSALGYRLVDSWSNCDPGVACHIAFRPDKSVSAYTGMYFRLS
jgi:putative methyltransferase (TIGR04325 family)